MNKTKSTQELFDEITNKIILPLETNETPCPTCKGLRFIYTQIGDKGYINNCPSCYNGKVKVCPHCGMDYITEHCDCDKAQEDKRIAQEIINSEREQKLFDKATKVKFDDYSGKFMLQNCEVVQDADEIYDWIYYKIKCRELSDEELPKYLWGTKPQSALTVDLTDIISSQCENNDYEDMYSNLDMNDMDDMNLIKAQRYLNKWYKKQGDLVNVYYEDYTVAVLLDDLIKDIREDVKKELK